MRIAILGAGYAGLASAFHLLYSFKKTPDELVIFDPSGVGGGASGAAAGLVHPFAGAHARKSPRADEAMATALRLFKAVDHECCRKTGLLRLAITEEQKIAFKTASEKYDGVQWLEREACSEMMPHAAAAPGIFIPAALTLYPEKYLASLWKKCAAKGARLEYKKIASLDKVDDFDAIIAATGPNLLELAGLPVRPLKGQALEYPWPENLPPLKTALSSHAYIVMSADNTRCIAGATFEREFESPGPDLDRALRLMQPKIAELFPPLLNIRPIGCRAGIRASAPNHQPIAKKIGPKCWALGGLGSKGLLYHALLAEEICKDLHSFIFSRSCS